MTTDPNEPGIRRRDRTTDTLHEREQQRAGFDHIYGLDEAGRGAWAGPVAAAAVCLPLHNHDDLKTTLRGVKDSKQMTVRQREAAYDKIQATALAWGIGYATAKEIDSDGIVRATHRAMFRALEMAEANYGLKPDCLLLDTIPWPDAPVSQTALVRIKRGDQHSLSIAAASVLAKVWRDKQMVELGKRYPQYGFERHKGYGAAAHRAAIEAHGRHGGVHRMTLRPLRAESG